MFRCLRDHHQGAVQLLIKYIKIAKFAYLNPLDVVQKIPNVTLSGFTFVIWQFVYIVRFLACVREFPLV